MITMEEVEGMIHMINLKKEKDLQKESNHNHSISKILTLILRLDLIMDSKNLQLYNQEQLMQMHNLNLQLNILEIAQMKMKKRLKDSTLALINLSLIKRALALIHWQDRSAILMIYLEEEVLEQQPHSQLLNSLPHKLLQEVVILTFSTWALQGNKIPLFLLNNQPLISLPLHLFLQRELLQAEQLVEETLIFSIHLHSPLLKCKHLHNQNLQNSSQIHLQLMQINSK